MSLRRQLLAGLLGAALAATMLTVAVGAVLVRGAVARQVVANVARQAQTLAETGVRRPLVARGGVRRRARTLAVTLPAGDVSGRRDGLAYARRGGVLVVRPARLRFADWRPFLLSLLIAGAGAAAIAAALAAVMAGRLARPVESAAMAADRHFLQSVTHELRTPLTAVRGYAEGIADGALDPHEAATVIGTEAARLQRLVDDLLELGRVQRPGFRVALGAVDLAELARRVERPGVVVDAPGPAPARGDGDRVVQVLTNLVENGLRAAGPNGGVVVTARPGTLCVVDSGPGLAPADVPRAFERFQSGARDGSGLGLAIVAELVRAMGGDIAVAGSAFTVTLQSVPAYAAASA